MGLTLSPLQHTLFKAEGPKKGVLGGSLPPPPAWERDPWSPPHSPSLSHICKTEGVLPLPALCLVRFKWDDLDKTPHSRCSREIFSLRPPGWPCDPRAVTGVIRLLLPQGVTTRHKDGSFLPKMSHMPSFLAQIQLDGNGLRPRPHFLPQVSPS